MEVLTHEDEMNILQAPQTNLCPFCSKSKAHLLTLLSQTKKHIATFILNVRNA